MKTETLALESAFGDLEKRAQIELSDRFRIEDVIGRGPASLVFRAFPTAGAPAVALKIVPKGAYDVGFLRATAAAAEMEHPHVVTVQLTGQTRHLLWYTMPLLADPSLDGVLRSAGPFELKRCLRMVEQIASALQYGHRRGTAHGGVKPENVFVNEAGWTVLADFGIPGAFARSPEEARSERLRAYAAPEVQEGDPIPASDQYALAVLVGECLTGSVAAGTTRSSTKAPAAELPLRVGHALRRAMAPAPQERFPTVLSFLAALDGGPAPVASTFSPAPNRKPEPRVLTMEPESRTRKMVIRALVLAAIGGLAFFSPRIWQAEQLAGFRDRFDHWYEADAPSGAMAGPGTEATAAPSSTEPSRPASDARGTPAASSTRAVSPPRSATGRAPAKSIAPPARRPASPPEPTPQPAPAPVTPGRLLVSATPWGILYVDGRPMGTTPVRDLQVAPGTHVVRITHEGYDPFEGSVEVTAGQEVRLTGIVLREAKR